MGTKILLLLFIALSSGFVAKAGGLNDNASGSHWELISESNGIRVLERWVTNEKNLKVKERTGKMTLNCSAEEVISLISDAEKTKLWMSNVESVRRLKTINNNEWVVYTVLDAPWPFNKQDMVSRYRVVGSGGSKKIKVLITKEDKLLTPQPDIDRLDTFNAEWVIETVRHNKVKVTFTTKSTKPPKYPSWAQDPVVRKVFFNNLKNFKGLINKV